MKAKIHKFYVIVNNETGQFYKKYHYNYNPTKPKSSWTPILGRARIFESYVKAVQALPSWGNITWITSGVATIKEMTATFTFE